MTFVSDAEGPQRADAEPPIVLQTLPARVFGRQCESLAGSLAGVAWRGHCMESIVVGLLYPIENSVQRLTGQAIDLPPITLQAGPTRAPTETS